MTAPRFLADEMLGRLARYLRMVGCDTTYVRGWPDDAIVARAREEGRILLTRDRALAARTPAAILLTGVDLPDQLRQLVHALPQVPREVAFVRCTLCNGDLLPVPADPDRPPRPERAGTPVFACASCGHRYWEGSHTSDVRRHLAAWIPGTAE